MLNKLVICYLLFFLSFTHSNGEDEQQQQEQKLQQQDVKTEEMSESAAAAKLREVRSNGDISVIQLENGVENTLTEEEEAMVTEEVAKVGNEEDGTVLKDSSSTEREGRGIRWPGFGKRRKRRRRRKHKSLVKDFQ